MAELIFNVQFRRGIRMRVGLILFAAGTVPFAAGLVTIAYLLASPTGLPATLVTVVCFMLGILLPWLGQDRLGLLGNVGLRHRVTEKALGADQPSQGLEFVGFSPGEDLRVWDGETDRDVGFLEVTGSALIYRGDRYEWSLRHSNIDAIEMLAMPGTLQRIQVAWHAPSQPHRGFTLASREVATMKEANRATRKLGKQLEEWYAEEPAQTEVPPLGSPPTTTAGSLPMDKLPAGSCLSVLSISAITLLSVWYIAQRAIAASLYCHAILWSGLIAVGAMMFASYFLSYLQAAEARETAGT